MDPVETLVALAEADNDSDRLELIGSIRHWVRSGGFKPNAAELLAKGASPVRVEDFLRAGWATIV